MSLKTIYSPQRFRSFKMGRKVPAHLPRYPKFADHLRATALPAPPAVDSYAALAAPGIAELYLNDTLGDCVIAGGYHVLDTWSGNATGGLPFIATDTEITADYSAIAGYVPGDPNTDNGTDLPNGIAYWTSHGFASGDKLVAAVSIDPTNRTELEQAVYLFENLYLGLNLPDAWVNPMPANSGFTWDVAGAPDSSNGHCVAVVGYTAQGLTIATWGMTGTMTWAAAAKYLATANQGECYALLAQAQLDKGQQVAPNALSWTSLVADFNAMGGNAPAPSPNPSPTPTPSPTPVPTPTPTPAPVGSWVFVNLMTNTVIMTPDLKHVLQPGPQVEVFPKMKQVGVPMAWKVTKVVR